MKNTAAETGRRLREERESRGWSQSELDAIDDIPAAKLNTAHQSALERAETDLRKAVSELQRLRSTFE